MQKSLSTKNKTLLPKDKVENLVQFFKLLKTNQPASLGPLDRIKTHY